MNTFHQSPNSGPHFIVLLVLPEQEETVSPLLAFLDKMEKDVKTEEKEDDSAGESFMDSGYGDSLTGFVK